MDKLNNIQIAKTFTLNEFECPCCRRVILHSDLLNFLIKLRKIINEPIFINSGYRCKNNNDQVGGTPKSYHTFGMAADIHARNIDIPHLAIYAQQAGFKGIGVYETFLHLDVRPVKYQWEG